MSIGRPNPKKSDNSTESVNQMIEDIGRKAKRKLRARRTRQESIWYGMGMVGIVGWSVAIPTVLGVAAGLWLDERVEVEFSWTLTLLITGVVIGCLNAWYWISKERTFIMNQRDGDENEGNDDAG